MKQNGLFTIVRGIFNSIPSLLTFAICLYFLIKKRNVTSILLAIGSFLVFALIFFFYFFYTTLIFTNDYINSETRIKLYDVISSIISFIASLSFAAGLFLLIRNYLQLTNKEENI